MKDEEIYNIFNTEKLLGRPAQVIIDAHSGLAGIAYWLKNNCPDEDARLVDKKSPIVLHMKELIDQEYASGRITTMSNSELLMIYRRVKDLK
jgi:isopropylmalate/homocitrate/citramalate synthase